MSELRSNILNGTWTVISPERGQKPESFKTDSVSDFPVIPDYSKDCPFCPGNEIRFSIQALSEIKSDDGKWQVRLVENKFKIFDDHPTCPISPAKFISYGVHTFFQGCGNHYLVLEHPSHNKIMGDMEPEQISKVFQCYLDGVRLLTQNTNNLISIIFKNQGPKAGGSQPHAHSQIVGSRVVPAWVRHALHTQERYFDDHGICAMCAILEFEIQCKERILLETEHTVILSPYAASTANEIWVIPKRHFACFNDVLPDEMKDMAASLQIVLKFYAAKLANPDYNYLFHTSPHSVAAVPFYHMFLQITPRKSIPGGFEMGTGISVNPLPPEEVKRTFAAYFQP